MPESMSTKGLSHKEISLVIEIINFTTDRSSHPEVFLGKAALKICSKFTGEHLCLSKCYFNKVALQLY